MNDLIRVSLMAWPILCLGLFAVWRPRRALLFTVVAGWLFLPPFQIPFLDLDKQLSIAVGSLLGLFLFDQRRLRTFRAGLIDAPMALWCLAPLLASLSNDLGSYDGLSETYHQTVRWGVPWFLGRVYFCDLEGLTELARALVIAGLVYAPLCLWEVRMSPSLCFNVYGAYAYSGVSYAGSLGAWGTRPSVFLRHPLELALVLTMACLAGLALSASARRHTLFGIPTIALTALLFMVSLACKNLGATILACVGAGLLHVLREKRSAIPVYLIALAVPAYITLRATNLWSGEEVVSLAAMVHEARAESFDFRLRNERILVDRALEQPLFGWGGWGRSRVFDEEGKDVSVTDGLWVISLGKTGLWGLATLLAALFVPVHVGLRRIPRGVRGHRAAQAALVFVVIMALGAVDNLANDFFNPLMLLGAGGVAGLPRLRAPSRKQLAARSAGPSLAPSEPAPVPGG